MGQYTHAIQQLYVAYFDRPADVPGLQYWENVANALGGDIRPIADAFAHSQEYRDVFAGKSNVEIVNQIYINLFGRNAEPGGLIYWSNLLDQHYATVDNIVTLVANGAQGTDASIVANKIGAATLFSNALTTTPLILAYSGANANAVAKAWLACIDSSQTDYLATPEFQQKLAMVPDYFSNPGPLPLPNPIPVVGTAMHLVHQDHIVSLPSADSPAHLLHHAGQDVAGLVGQQDGLVGMMFGM